MTNPYAASELPAEQAEEAFIPHVTDENPFIRPMFALRKVALAAVGVVLFFESARTWTSPLPEVIYSIAYGASAFALTAFWYILFRASARNSSILFGIGHVLASIFLTPCLLIGVILVPVLIRGDAERLAEESPHAFGP